MSPGRNGVCSFQDPRSSYWRRSPIERSPIPEHVQRPGRWRAPSKMVACKLTHHRPSAGYSNALSGQSLPDDAYMVRPADPMATSPLLHLLCCEVRLLVRRHVVWTPCLWIRHSHERPQTVMLADWLDWQKRETVTLCIRLLVKIFTNWEAWTEIYSQSSGAESPRSGVSTAVFSKGSEQESFLDFSHSPRCSFACS